jgi:hypothetical protein
MRPLITWFWELISVYFTKSEAGCFFNKYS